MASFGQIRSSSGRQLDYTPQGWINNEGQNLNDDPGTGQVLRSDGRLSQLADLSSFLTANNTSMQNLVDYNGKKAFRTPEGDIVWQNPDGSTGKAIVGVTAINKPAAPHLTEIVDPKNPSRLIRIDANTYRGGSLGSPGVIGESGKEPVAASLRAKSDAKSEEKMAGQQDFSAELDNMQSLYNKLNELKAIPSTRRSGASNFVSSLQSSGMGQLGGKMFGTEEQQLRDEIASGRMRLMQAVKKATGMSAQQMNSNVELQTMLNSLGDPSKTYEANAGILDQMRVRYGGGSSDTQPNDNKSSTDYQQTLFNAKKAIARNPAAREGIINKMKAAGYDVKGL